MGLSQYAYNPLLPLASTVPKLFMPGDDIVGYDKARLPTVFTQLLHAGVSDEPLGPPHERRLLKATSKKQNQEQNRRAPTAFD